MSAPQATVPVLKSNPHRHTCNGCGEVYPHTVNLCTWPEPWYCPDCALRHVPDDATIQ